MNDIYDWIMFFLFAICIIITGVSVYKWTDWKRESNENLELFLKEKAELDEKNKELEEAKSWQKVIKIEQVHLEPRELECKFAIHPTFVDDTEQFKKILVGETARYLAEEIERDPYLCKVFHSVNSFDCREEIKVRFRMLPYPEGVVWEDVLKKEEEK
jgi:hypothetical protein